jgi:hypothetical protein
MMMPLTFDPDAIEVMKLSAIALINTALAGCDLYLLKLDQ